MNREFGYSGLTVLLAISKARPRMVAPIGRSARIRKSRKDEHTVHHTYLEWMKLIVFRCQFFFSWEGKSQRPARRATPQSA